MSEFFHSKIESIQVLRGLAALLVVCEHVRFLGFGAYGVDIFFAISGFIMMYTTADGMNAFLRKRFIRIVPLYWLVTTAIFAGFFVVPGLFQSRELSPRLFLESLLFYPQTQNGGEPILPVGWTVEFEVFFYLVFFVAGHISHKYRAVISSIIIYAAVYYRDTHGWKSPRIILAFGDRKSLEFIYGMIAFYVISFIYTKRKYISKQLSYVALCIGLFMLAITPILFPIPEARYYSWGILGVLIIIAFYIAGLNIKSPKPLVFLGDISFSIYLLHYYIIKIVDVIFNFESFTLKAFIGVLVALAAIIGCSYISYELVEKRFTRYLKRKLIK